MKKGKFCKKNKEEKIKDENYQPMSLEGGISRRGGENMRKSEGKSKREERHKDTESKTKRMR